MGTIFDKFDLTGKVAVVTGGVGLLGKGFCRTLAQAGAKVVVADLNKDAADAYAETLQAEGLQAMGVGVNVTQPDSAQAMVDKTPGSLGPSGCAGVQRGNGSKIRCR